MEKLGKDTEKNVGGEVKKSGLHARIAAGVPCPGDVWDFFIGKAAKERNLPVGVVSPS